MHFTKLFNSILDSTIWQESKETKIVWVTMLAMCDRFGEIHASIPGLAARSGVTIPECESALLCLLSPDSYSRTKAYEGRRIEEIDGGWVLLNHGKYRALLSAEERKEYNRIKQKEHRAKMSLTVNDKATQRKHCQHITEAEAEAEATQTQDAIASTVVENPPEKPKRERVTFKKPTCSEVVEYIKEIGATIDGQEWMDHYEANGWMVGRNKMKDWKATVRNWEARRKTNLFSNGNTNGTKPVTSESWSRVVEGFRKFDLETERQKLESFIGPDIWPAVSLVGARRIYERTTYDSSKIEKEFAAAMRLKHAK